MKVPALEPSFSYATVWALYGGILWGCASTRRTRGSYATGVTPWNVVHWCYPVCLGHYGIHIYHFYHELVSLTCLFPKMPLQRNDKKHNIITIDMACSSPHACMWMYVLKHMHETSGFDIFHNQYQQYSDIMSMIHFHQEARIIIKTDFQQRTCGVWHNSQQLN